MIISRHCSSIRYLYEHGNLNMLFCFNLSILELIFSIHVLFVLCGFFTWCL